MPIYEYQCLDCDAPFEVFARTMADGGPAHECPACEGTRTRKRFSVFAAVAASAPDAGFSCGSDSCCGGACLDD